jgi:VCBS repeat-containing protein
VNFSGIETIVTPAPRAVDDAYTAAEDETLTVPARSGVLANDTDAVHSRLSAELVSGPSHGTLSLKSDGSFDYTPASDTEGITDHFTYRARNAADTPSNVATVAIRIALEGDCPECDG